MREEGCFIEVIETSSTCGGRSPCGVCCIREEAVPEGEVLVVEKEEVIEATKDIEAEYLVTDRELEPEAGELIIVEKAVVLSGEEAVVV